MAGIAERLLDIESGETTKLRTLPVGLELCRFVKVFDERDVDRRAEKIAHYKATGVKAEGRSKRKR